MIEEDTGGAEREKETVLSGFMLAKPPTNTPARFKPPTNTPARFTYNTYGAHVCKYLIRKTILKEISI